jgi:hypothetical protein
LPVSTSQILTTPSTPPEAIQRPSGDIAQSLTEPVCYSNVKIADLLLALKSHIFTLESADEVAIIWDYSSYAILVTLVLCPAKIVGD